MNVNRAILPNPQNIEPCNRPDDHEDKEHIHGMRKLEERRRIQNRAHSRHASGQRVIDHDGGYCNERNRRPQNQVRKRVDSTPEDPMVFEDFRDLYETGSHVVDEQRGECDKNDGTRADETMGLCCGIEDRSQLVHQGNDGDGQPGEPDLSTLKIGEQSLFPQ